MSLPINISWPTSGSLSDDWLGVRATWSLPMSQSGLAPGRIQALERELQSEMQRGIAEGIDVAFNRRFEPETRIEVQQIGSAAETFHGIFAWLENIPNEILIALLADGSVRGFSALVGNIKGRISAFRRDEAQLEISAELSLHPNLLLKLCMEHATLTYGFTSVEGATWRELSESEREDIEPIWPTREQYMIEIAGSGTSLSYRVDESGTVHEHRVKSLQTDSPQLISDIHPVPVPPPIYEDPFTGEKVEGWPAQDGIDRSEHIAFIAILSADFGEPVEDMDFVNRAGQISGDVQRQLERAVQAAVSDLMTDVGVAGIEAEHYQVGPMAGGLIGIEHYIVELFESRDAIPPIVDNVSKAWIVCEIAKQVWHGLKSWVSGFGDSRLDIAVSFPPAVLVAICEQHVRVNYHPRAKLTSEWHCLTNRFFGGYVSPGHPTGSVEYLVQVHTSRKSYRYTVWGDGLVTSHWMKEGTKQHQLPPPKLLNGEKEAE